MKELLEHIMGGRGIESGSNKSQGGVGTQP
jgi:hypothetical protein